MLMVASSSLSWRKFNTFPDMYFALFLHFLANIFLSVFIIHCMFITLLVLLNSLIALKPFCPPPQVLFK